MTKKTKYSIETKLKAIELKQQGYSTTYILKELGIKNKTQVDTWLRWAANGELHRLHQPIGKQYTYQLGVSELSELEQMQLRVQELEMQNEILGKLKGILES